MVYRFLSFLEPAALLKEKLWHRCFPVNFVKFLRKPFLTVHLRATNPSFNPIINGDVRLLSRSSFFRGALPITDKIFY